MWPSTFNDLCLRPWPCKPWSAWTKIQALRSHLVRRSCSAQDRPRWPSTLIDFPPPPSPVPAGGGCPPKIGQTPPARQISKRFCGNRAVYISPRGLGRFPARCCGASLGLCCRNIARGIWQAPWGAWQISLASRMSEPVPDVPGTCRSGPGPETLADLRKTYLVNNFTP